MSENVIEQNTDDKASRPMMLIAQLLFREKPETCSDGAIGAALEKYAGELGEGMIKPEIVGFPVLKYKCVFEDRPEGIPPVATFLPPSDFKPQLDELITSQFWDVENGAEFIGEMKYEIPVFATLSAALSYPEQAELFMAQLDAAADVYPDFDAIFIPASGKLVTAEKFRDDRQWELSGRFINTAVNVRFFTIQDTNDMLIDSLGMYIMGLPDVQVHFHDLDPNHVVNYVYNIVDYQFNNDFPIEDGDTLDSIGEDGRTVWEPQWKTRYENALIQPVRPVLDINCGDFAAGNRD